MDCRERLEFTFRRLGFDVGLGLGLSVGLGLGLNAGLGFSLGLRTKNIIVVIIENEDIFIFWKFRIRVQKFFECVISNLW